MRMTLNKLNGFVARLVCKAYEFVLIIYTRLRRGLDDDPSKILVDFYTESQVQAQLAIDHLFANAEMPTGEILVIIPFRDRWDLTSACLKSLQCQVFTASLRMKVVLVDNGSTSPATAQGIKAARSNYPSLMIETLRADYPFNFSKLNNDGFQNYKNSATRLVLFLNNDIEFLGHDTIEKMAICLTNLREAGAVGSTLLYPDGKVQHLFAAPGVKIIAAHPLKGTPFNQLTAWFEKPVRPVPAVTGAVMMLRADDFERVGMFDEALPTLGQDVVLCALVLQKLKKYSVVLTKAEVLHHESVTKSVSFPAAELKLIYDKYGDALNSNTFFNDVFSRWSEQPLIALPWELSYPAKTIARFWQ